MRFNILSAKVNCKLDIDKMQIKYHEIIFYMVKTLNYHIFLYVNPYIKSRIYNKPVLDSLHRVLDTINHLGLSKIGENKKHFNNYKHIL